MSINTVTDILVHIGFCKSKKEAKRLILSGGVRLNDVKIDDPNMLVWQHQGKIVYGHLDENDNVIIHPCSYVGEDSD